MAEFIKTPNGRYIAEDFFRRYGKKTLFPTTIEEKEKVLSEMISIYNKILSPPKVVLVSALRLGEMLSKKKEELEYGNWEDFIDKNLPFTIRTAQHYLSLYNNKDKIAKVESLREAYKLLKIIK